MTLTFQQHPDVRIGTLTFRNVPTIIQFEDTPLIEVKNTEAAGWSAHFHIFHPDGTPIAVVKGAGMYLTAQGKKAALKLRHEPDLIVCELDGKALFELRHAGASALKAWAELYTPTGVLIKASDSIESLMPESGDFTQVGKLGISGAIFDGCPVAIRVLKDGTVGMWLSMAVQEEFTVTGPCSFRAISHDEMVIELSEATQDLVKVKPRKRTPFDNVPVWTRPPATETVDLFVWSKLEK